MIITHVSFFPLSFLKFVEKRKRKNETHVKEQLVRKINRWFKVDRSFCWAIYLFFYDKKEQIEIVVLNFSCLLILQENFNSSLFEPLRKCWKKKLKGSKDFFMNWQFRFSLQSKIFHKVKQKSSFHVLGFFSTSYKSMNIF